MSVLFAPFRGLTDLIYPPRCRLCEQPIEREQTYCAVCAGALFHDPHLCCPRCGARVGPFAVTAGTCAACRKDPVAFEATLRLGPYVGPLRDAVLRIKSNRNEGLAEELGEHLAEVHRQRFDALAPEYIVPVPLHPLRRLIRGYNQSAAIAFGLGAKLRRPCRFWWLWQVRRTQPQKSLTATQRRENVRGAYRVRAGVRLDGLHILLVDDVMTTGATADEAARAIKRAGAARVSIAVLARAEG